MYFLVVTPSIFIFPEDWQLNLFANNILLYGHDKTKETYRLVAGRMKVLSMIQPWASLFVLRENEFETRSWKTNYRGPLAIHTSKKIDKAVCRHVAIRSLLGKHGYTEETLPTGMIIAVGRLENCLKITEKIRHQQSWKMDKSYQEMIIF